MFRPPPCQRTLKSLMGIPFAHGTPEGGIEGQLSDSVQKCREYIFGESTCRGWASII